MNITDIQKTPNPNALKFVIDEHITPPYESLTFDSIDDIEDNELAESLLSLESIQSVFMHGQWITVHFQSEEDSEDQALLKKVGKTIRNHDPSPINDGSQTSTDDPDDPKLMLIQDVLTKDILPYLRSHGGSAEVVELDEENNIVFIQYKGACGGCPISEKGTLRAIEKALQKEVDPDIEVKSV